MVTKVYDEYYSGSYSSGAQLGRFQWVKEQFIGEIQGKTIVEIGGGDEGLIALLKSKNQVLQADVSKRAVIKSRKKGIKSIVFDANIDRLPLAAKSVDIVVALEVIEHLKAPQHMIDEVSRVLKKDGFTVISVPNAKKLRKAHGYFYTALFEFKNFNEFLKINGFNIIKVLPYGDYSFLSQIQGNKPFFFFKRLVFKLILYFYKNYDFDTAHLFYFKINIKKRVNLEEQIAMKTKDAYL